MSLAAHLEAMQRLFLGPEPGGDELAAVGDPARLRIYRSMVRARLVEISKNAFPRTHQALGAETFQGVVDRYLEGAGPRTRYFWRIPLELFEVLGAAIPADAPPHVRDLARFEVARWSLRHEAFPPPPTPAPLSFERPPLLNPAHALVSVRHRVDVRDEEHVAGERELCLHRGADHKVAVLVLNPVSHALLVEWRAGEAALADSVKRVCERRNIEITEHFLEKLSSLLESFLGAGLLLGSAPA
jgi:hypothetical protein